MGKDLNLDVRGHSQEREWLLNLGGGNIVDGVKNLVEQMTRRQSSWDDYPREKSGKFGRWRDNYR